MDIIKYINLIVVACRLALLKESLTESCYVSLIVQIYSEYIWMSLLLSSKTKNYLNFSSALIPQSPLLRVFI